MDREFQGAIAELEGLVSERGTIVDTQKQTGSSGYAIDRLLKIQNRIEPVICKVRLMVGPTSPNMPLVALIGQWRVADDSTKRVGLGF